MDEYLKELDLSQCYYIDLENADLSNVTSYGSMFSSVNESTQIIVKDETQRTWLTSKFTYLTNIVLASEL